MSKKSIATASVLMAMGLSLALTGCAPAAGPGAGSGSAPVEEAVAPEDGKGEGAAGKEPAGTDDAAGGKEDETALPATGGEGPSGASRKAGSEKQGSKPSPGSSPASKPSGSGPSSASKPSGGGSSKPSHTHSWQAVYRTEPVYEQRWVSNWVDVYKGRQEGYECMRCGCGYTCYSRDEWRAHVISTDEAGDMHGNYTDASYDIWEKEDHGSYRQVQTGTKQVLDHYSCPCGATK